MAGAALLLCSVMFWNLECYFDPFDNPLTEDNEYTPEGRRHWTWRQFAAKRDGIAKTIAAAADSLGEMPVIVGLAEVENYMVVRQLCEETMLSRSGYGIVHRDSPDRRGIDVALLYRKKQFKVLCVKALPVRSGHPTRDILYVKGVLNDGSALHLLVNHWPSKLGGESVSGLRRKAASEVLCSCIDSIRRASPGEEIIAMGDFNDTPPQITPMVGGRLHNACLPLFEAGKGTIKYKGEWELIDQFFCSNPERRMMIFAPAFLLEKDSGYTGMKPRRTFTGPRNHGGLSDHLPILLK